MSSRVIKNMEKMEREQMLNEIERGPVAWRHVLGAHIVEQDCAFVKQGKECPVVAELDAFWKDQQDLAALARRCATDGEPPDVVS